MIRVIYSSKSFFRFFFYGCPQLLPNHMTTVAFIRIIVVYIDSTYNHKQNIMRNNLCIFISSSFFLLLKYSFSNCIFDTAILIMINVCFSFFLSLFIYLQKNINQCLNDKIIMLCTNIEFYTNVLYWPFAFTFIQIENRYKSCGYPFHSKNW